MKKTNVVRVMVPAIFWQALDYEIPEDVMTLVQVGMRVTVPLGRRQVVGLIGEVGCESQVQQSQLKPFCALLDDTPLVTESWIALMRWVSDYYHHPIGQTVFTAIPKRLKAAKPLPTVKTQSVAEVGFLAPTYCLSPEQSRAIERIQSAESFSVFLLDGITGSGKTEVYMQAMNTCLQEGQQVLVLVPEIGLTPQTLERFQRRFSVPVVELHSRLAEVARAKNWLRVRQAVPMIVIGTRSAVFAPFANLGMIVVDEEHDLSFKQQSGLRYSARDVAVKRAQGDNISVILGSATPSLESVLNSRKGNYIPLILSERVAGSRLPIMTLLDMRHQAKCSGLSQKLIDKIRLVLEQDQQVLIFINRRGYAPVMMCHHCGWIVTCAHCETNLVFHKVNRRLCCHQCDRVTKPIKYCQKCKQEELAPVGYGTQRLDEELSDIFKGTPIIRVDRDSTRRKNSMGEILDSIHENKSAILVGTQMLAKGHHFTRLNLVVMLDLDSGLLSLDFRAQERLAQLIYQVAGRAGRGESVGEVVIQTYQPEHRLYQHLLKRGYRDFISTLLQQREEVSLPPYHFMALLNAESKQYDKTVSFLDKMKRILTADQVFQGEVWGPVPAPLSKRRDLYRCQLVVKSASRKALQHAILSLVRTDKTALRSRDVRWSVDIDPLDML